MTTNLIRRVRIPATALLVTILVFLSGPALGASIDPWPSYDGQTKCSPTAKKGTLKLAAYLQKHYKGSGSYGISRACGSGGRSEHKEGRAFDWRVNVNRAKERGYAMDFIKRIRATDSAGNADALARRMGIMYVIFNDKIYSSSHGFAARSYLNASCRSRSSCSATLRHRDHMHISLTRAGGAGKTSWYSGHVLTGGGGSTTSPSSPDMTHEDSGIPTTSLARPEVLTAVPGSSASTRLAVRKGQRVKVTAYGVTRFGPGHQLVSDAACVWDGRTRTWATAPRSDVRAAYGDPQLKVNGVAVFARSSCRGGQHVYSATVVQPRTAPLRVSLGGRNQGDGAVRVVLSRAGASVGSLIPRVPALAKAPALDAPVDGAIRAVSDDVRIARDEVIRSDDVLEAGVDYRVTVSGVRQIARGVYTDGQCVALDGRWERQGSMDLYHPAYTHGALYIGGVRFAGSAPDADLTGCQLHSHTMSYRPEVTGRVALRVWDPTGPGDNDGALNVRFDRVTPVAMPTAAPAETVRTGGDWSRTSETFTVPADEAEGRISAFRLKAGKTAMIYVEGKVDVTEDRSADASCVADGWSWLRTLGLPSDQDVFELSVDGQDVDWRASRTRESECDYRHKYSVRYTAQKNGPLRLALVDLDYGDNDGYYAVTIVRQ